MAVQYLGAPVPIVPRMTLAQKFAQGFTVDQAVGLAPVVARPQPAVTVAPIAPPATATVSLWERVSAALAPQTAPAPVATATALAPPIAPAPVPIRAMPTIDTAGTAPAAAAAGPAAAVAVTPTRASCGGSCGVPRQLAPPIQPGTALVLANSPSLASGVPAAAVSDVGAAPMPTLPQLAQWGSLALIVLGLLKGGK